MDSDEFVLSSLMVAPEHRLVGKKRIHKLAMLLKAAGLNLAAEFRMHHYGPYSDSIAEAIEGLSLVGSIDESAEPVGAQGTFVSVFELPREDGEVSRTQTLPDPYASILIALDQYTTIELEVASTIRYFELNGKTPGEARARTRAMKPRKANRAVVQKVGEILKIVDSA